jgi:hypothetical protein
MEFSCDHCGQKSLARDEFIGEQVVCVGCERMTEIPQPPLIALTDPAVATAVWRLGCPWCGYRLQGLPDNRCPECGRRFDPLYLVATRWGQKPTPMPVGEQLLAAAIALALMLFLIWGALTR